MNDESEGMAGRSKHKHALKGRMAHIGELAKKRRERKGKKREKGKQRRKQRRGHREGNCKERK